MLKIWCQLIAVVFFLMSFLNLNAQKIERQNSIQVAAGYAFIDVGTYFSYERLIRNHGPVILIKTEIGQILREESSLGIIGIGFLSHAKKNNHFEIIGGGAIAYNSHMQNSISYTPCLSLGYRHQKPNGRFLFRAAISNYEFISLGFGFAF